MVLNFLLLYIISVRVLTNIKKCRNTKFELIAMMFGIFIVLAFRDSNSGTDTWNYLANFLRIKNYSFESLVVASTQEKGFLLFQWILGKVFPNSVQVLFIFQALIVTLSYGYFIYKYCKKNYFLAVLGFMAFGLFGFHTTGVRQSLAMALCVWVYILFEKKKYFSAIIIAVLATTFHLSAIVSVLYLIYGNIWKRRNNLFTTVMLGIVLALTSGTILARVSLFSERWNQYSDIESTGNGQIFYVVLIIILLLGETLNKENDEYQFSKRVNYLTYIFWTGRLVTRTMQRPAMYFFPANLPVLVNGIENYTHLESRKLLRIGAFIGISLLYIYRFRGYSYHLISLF